jgi:hypothetical protein
MPKTSCRAKNREGGPCRAAAGAGGLCYLHANPDSAKTLGRQGGRKNRHFTGVDVEVPPNMNASDLNALGSRTIGLVLSGELQAREAGAIAQLINAQVRTIPLVEYETRMRSIEQQLGELLQQRQAASPQGREEQNEDGHEDEASGDIETESLPQAERQRDGFKPEAIESGEAVARGDEPGAGVDT